MERSQGRSTLLLSIFFILVSAAAAAITRDTITPTTPLSNNETLVCSGETFALGFFTPSGTDKSYVGLWYNLISEPDGHTILWVANRLSPLVGGSSGALLSVTPDGRLTITSGDKTVVWTSPTSTVRITNAVAQLLDSGNLVVKQDGDNNYGWEGFNYLTDTLIPGIRLGLDRTTGISRTLVSWASPTDPSPGNYSLSVNVKGDPEVYFYQGSTPIWRTGAWDGKHLSGVLDMIKTNAYSYGFANNASEVTYFYSASNQSMVSRLIVNSTGVLQRALWMWDSSQWNYFWAAPKDPCDFFGACGPYGLCDSNTSPLCSCLTKGFSPKNPANWINRDGRDGCVRVHGLDCRNGTDGFNKVSNVKLPQSENCTVDLSMNLDRCQQSCLQNCSCVAYASADVRNGGSGCVIWAGDRLFDIRNFVIGGGQDLYVRVAAADVVAMTGKSSSDATVAIVVSLVVGGLLLICVGFFLWWRKKKRKAPLGTISFFNEPVNRETVADHDLDLPLFDFDSIAAATDHFSSAHLLGEGGFGPVYKGNLGDGQEIAVKRLSKTSSQGTEEFKNEVMLIAKLQHRNLVRLLGCCIQGEEHMLIYEYLPNIGLDAFLFDICSPPLIALLYLII